jgi:sugar phosphate isomerase/epimerase
MKLVLFSKELKNLSEIELIRIASELGIDGYDLCVRDGYQVSPATAEKGLSKLVKKLGEAGLAVPQITSPGDFLLPDDSRAEPILAGMQAAEVKFLKLGYFKFDPHEEDYWEKVDHIRKAFSGWEKLAEKYGVTICYHTHQNRCMGMNGGTLAHLLKGFNPDYIGAYLDPFHLRAEGEEFAVALAIVKEYLKLVALKDLTLHRREKDNHGCVQWEIVEAGHGMVDWSAVFSDLSRIGYDGPYSVHCEFEGLGKEELLEKAKREVNWFRGKIGKS